MGTAIMMYMLPMMLGKTFDMKKNTPGIQIFSEEAVKGKMSLQRYFTDSQYRMVDNTDEMKDFLDVTGKLSLMIKSGLIQVSGEGSYVKDSSSRTNAVEILAKVSFETVTETLPSSVKPNPDWILQDKKYLGTHFCRSITYGGNLIASIRFTAANRYDKERIKGAIQGGIKAGESFEAEVKAQLEKLKDEMQDGTSMEINYYASVPVPGVPYTIEGLMKLVEGFPDHVKAVNNGLGTPLRMELFPLSSLDSVFPTYLENRALNDQLDDLEDQFDDLRRARRETGLWVKSLPPVIPPNVKTRINDFLKTLDSIFGTFMNSISELDLSMNGTTKPFEEAFSAYKWKSHSLPNKYIWELRKFREKIYEEEPSLKPLIGGATYTHWGKSKCEDPTESETAVSGVGVSSENNKNGGSSDFICVPLQPELSRPKDLFPTYDPNDDDIVDHLLVSPLRYSGELQKFKEKQEKMIACAICRIRQRKTLLVKMAATQCPSNWTKEYEGTLMAPGIDDAKGEYICVDSDMEIVSKVNFGNSDLGALGKIREVTVQCGALPCGPYKENTPIRCVVCTI